MKDITPADSIVPVYLVPLTAEEEAEREQWAIEEAARQEEAAAKEAARISAIDKLTALGLSDAEVAALIG